MCDNAGFDATEILNKLRMRHDKGKEMWAGVDIINEGIQDNLEKFVWEPIAVKVNAIQAATEAACLILSVDETISKCARVNSSVMKLTAVYRESRVCCTTGGRKDACRGCPEGTQDKRENA